MTVISTTTTFDPTLYISFRRFPDDEKVIVDLGFGCPPEEDEVAVEFKFAKVELNPALHLILKALYGDDNDSHYEDLQEILRVAFLVGYQEGHYDGLHVDQNFFWENSDDGLQRED